MIIVSNRRRRRRDRKQCRTRSVDLHVTRRRRVCAYEPWDVQYIKGQYCFCYNKFFLYDLFLLFDVHTKKTRPFWPRNRTKSILPFGRLHVKTYAIENRDNGDNSVFRPTAIIVYTFRLLSPAMEYV